MVDESAEPLEAVVVQADTSNPIVTVLAWVGVAVALFIIVGWVWTRWINPSAGGVIDRYAHNNSGVIFESPADQFSVTLPTAWHRTTTKNDLGTIVTVASEPGADYSFSATKTPEPVTALESYKSSLNQVAGQLVASNAGADIVSQTEPVPFVDVAVKTVVYRKGDTYWRASLQLLKDRLYTIVARTPNSDEAPFSRLVTSFKILGAR